MSKRKEARSQPRESGRAHREVPIQPFEPGRAEPPLPIVDDLEGDAAPPEKGKVRPRADMSDAVPSLDDEVRELHRHPSDAGTTDFEFDPDAADAAADLAGDLGQTYLEGATRADDVSDIAMEMSDREESDLPYIIEDEEAGPEDSGVVEERPARRRAR